MNNKRGGSTKRFTAKEKLAAIEDVVIHGISNKVVAENHGMGYSTLHNFIADYKKNGNQMSMNEQPNVKPQNKDLAVIESRESILEKKLSDSQLQVASLKGDVEILKKTIGIFMAD